MKKILVGASKGIGRAILNKKLKNSIVYNISRTSPDTAHCNLIDYSLDVLKDPLPDIEHIDSLIYCPGTINLKPFQSLHADDFRNDFEINVMGAVRVMHKYLPILKKGEDPSIVLLSTVAAKLGMPFHAGTAATKTALEGLVRSLGAELAGQVRINAVARNITHTPLSESILRNDKIKESIKERHPMKITFSPVKLLKWQIF